MVVFWPISVTTWCPSYQADGPIAESPIWRMIVKSINMTVSKSGLKPRSASVFDTYLVLVPTAGYVMIPLANRSLQVTEWR